MNKGMKDGKLQVGIIGIGKIARDQHVPGWAKVPFAEIAMAADVSEAAFVEARKICSIPRYVKDWHELVETRELDAVDICTPNRTHAAIALSALESGKHVLVEKPIATSALEVQALIEASHRTGKLVMTMQHFRFEPAARYLKKLVDEGIPGGIYYTRAQWLRRRLLPPQPTFIERRLSGGGPIFDLGVHLLDLACWLMSGPEPLTVSACADQKLAQRSDLTGDWGDWDHERIDVEDFAAGFVRFAGGATMTLETSWLGLQQEGELRRLQCFGTEAGFLWPDGVVSGETARKPWDKKMRKPRKVSGHHEGILQFALAVRDGRPSPVPPEQSLQVIRILEGFYQSARLGREVQMGASTAAPLPEGEG
jgi:predicted dehydrogenase